MPTDPSQGPTGGLTPHITIRDRRAAEAIDFYKAAFAAEEQASAPTEDGRLMHAYLHINGGGLILNDDFPEFHQGSYNAVPGGFGLHLQVADAAAWFDRAVAAGATVRMALQDMFWGDRYGQLIDPFGIQWTIGQTLGTESKA
jgi:PhnB protein